MSPVKGLSERIRMPRLGKIHLGIMVERNGAKFPRATDYFVCPEVIRLALGDDKPKQLHIIFPSNDDSQIAAQFYRLYSRTRGLVCKGDGTTAMSLVDKATGEIAPKDAKETELRECDCNLETCKNHLDGSCNPVLNLQFMLPDVPGLGVWQIDTSSINSILNINNGLRMVRAVCGTISAVPLILRLVPQEVQADGKKKTVHVLLLDAPFSLTKGLWIADDTRPQITITEAQPKPKAAATKQLTNGNAPKAQAQKPCPDCGSNPCSCGTGTQETQTATQETPQGSLPIFQQADLPKPESIANFGMLYMEAAHYWGLTRSEVMVALGVTNQSEMGTPQEAWKKLLEAPLARKSQTKDSQKGGI